VNSISTAAENQAQSCTDFGRAISSSDYYIVFFADLQNHYFELFHHRAHALTITVATRIRNLFEVLRGNFLKKYICSNLFSIQEEILLIDAPII